MAKRTTLFDLAEYLRGTVEDVRKEQREDERMALSLLQLGAQIEQHRDNRHLQIENLKQQHLKSYMDGQKQLISIGGVPSDLSDLSDIDSTGNALNAVENYSTWLKEFNTHQGQQVENLAWAQKGNQDAMDINVNGDNEVTKEEISNFILKKQLSGELKFPSNEAELNYRTSAEMDADTIEQLMKLSSMITDIEYKQRYTEHIQKKTDKLGKVTPGVIRTAQGAKNDFDAGKDAFLNMKQMLRLAYADKTEDPQSDYAHKMRITINPETGSSMNLHDWLRKGMTNEKSPQYELHQIFGIVNPSAFGGYSENGHDKAYKDMGEGRQYQAAGQWISKIQGDFHGSYSLFETSNEQYILGVQQGVYNVDGSNKSPEDDTLNKEQLEMDRILQNMPAFNITK